MMAGGAKALDVKTSNLWGNNNKMRHSASKKQMAVVNPEIGTISLMAHCACVCVFET